MEYLDKYRTKPVPKKRTEFKVAAPKSDVVIDVKIVDKRADEMVDRTALLERIKRKELQPPALPVEIPTDMPDVAPPKSTMDEGGPAEPVLPKKKRKPRKKKPLNIPHIALDEDIVRGIMLGDTIVEDRLASLPPDVVKYSSYYLNNRQVFIDSISAMFDDYRQELLDEDATELSCDRESGDFTLLIHQKIIRDYINIYSPYRGLLLYHGLGSGKTCSSIAIAEGIKSTKQVIVMTPASLQMNYIKELKFCGDHIYKKKQFWEFIPTEPNSQEAQVLAKVLNVTVEYINKNRGAWMVNIKRPPNFDSLDTASKKLLDEQLNVMIHSKYKFINYNGMRKEHLTSLKKEYGEKEYGHNPFSNKVIIIDEAHNFISRIVNKLGKKTSLSYKLYELLKSAENSKIIFLTGTPIINYPNEIAVMFNILRGYIQTFNIPIIVSTSKRVDEKSIQKVLTERMGTIDTVKYVVSKKLLIVTRNPYGFVNNFDETLYKGVTLDETGNISNEKFLDILIGILKTVGIEVNTGGVEVKLYPALPDKLDDFRAQFVKESGDMFNIDKFKRRIVGLTSYFRSAQESLMPRYDKEKNFHIVRTEMSDFQLGIYEEARKSERKLEKSSKKKKRKQVAGDDLYSNSISTYRIFSRAFCNFVFPSKIGRPFPKEEESIDNTNTNLDEDLLDNASVEQRLDNTDGRFTLEEVAELEKEQASTVDQTYDQRIVSAMEMLWLNKETYLSVEGLNTLSPKFVALLGNLTNREHVGNHLIYSQFRTIEGIGVIRLVLMNNGFAEFKLRNTGGVWNIVNHPDDEGKPRFVLYTGTESVEEKEIVRNIFNGKWDNIPTNIRDELQTTATDNKYGDIIKIFMITAAGAEGIDLKNVRFVHLIEPYWHPVRLEQVIGRANRICSHDQLPETHRTVDVFLYLMTFSEKQLQEDSSIELRLNDKSKIDKTTPLTSDEALNEISNIKNDINKQLLHSVKETSIDCSVHSKGRSNPENINCYSFTTSDSTKQSFKPSVSEEEDDIVRKVNQKKVTWKARLVNIEGTKYAFRTDTNEVYDLLSYKAALKGEVEPTKIGVLVNKPNGKKGLVRI
jgi:hypothetical protein